MMDEFDEEGDDVLSTVMYSNTATYTKNVAQPKSLSQKSAKNNGCTSDSKIQKLRKCHEIPDRQSLPNDDDISIPDEFTFPFKPYDIQVDFMKQLYKTLELGKIGIFESPTGTGKSLSLICGAVRWLKDFKEREKERLEKLLEDKNKEVDKKESATKPQSGELDWIVDFQVKQKQDEELKLIQEEKDKILKRESQLSALKKYVKPTKRKREKLENDFDLLMKDASNDVKQAYEAELETLGIDENSINSLASDEHMILKDYHSDEEGEDKADNEDELDDELHVTKIYYCSRTHSQLSQFVREVMKSPYGDDASVVSLGSRQNMCINDTVRRLKSLSLINDKCLEMKRNKSGKKVTPSDGTPRKKTKGEGCPFHKQEEMQDFKDKVLVDIQDVEQLVTMGKQMKACPYYGTRLAIPSAEIVALPYNTLLHKSTREACGIKLKDQIVIIDEAHNLLETINNIYSVEISGAQVMRAYSQLLQYETKFRSRLKAKNLMYVKQIIHVLSSCIKYLGGKLDVSADKQFIGKSESRLLTINTFLFETKLDNINLFKVLRYCKRSEISKKLHGFVEKYQPSEVVCNKEKVEENNQSGLSKFLQEIKQGNVGKKPEAVSLEKDPSPQEEITLNSPLMQIEGFFEALTNADKNGRIVVSRQGLLSQSKLKFLLLNPAVHFTSILEEARAIIVAGGTMQPISDFKDQLFYSAGVQPERLLEFSCGHVIPSDNLLPIALSTGPSGREFDFTYQSRDNPHLLDELGRTIINICNLVPGGIVCFFPSYDYEKQVYTHWESKGFLMKISAKKKIFREPKRAGQVDQILDEYTSCIQKCGNGTYSNSNVTGSLLLSVVGGKMSEGINFSDDLGRCIVMIGLPYPNIRSPELKEKMDYLNANYPKTPDGKLPGQIHYENLCMKAVNQSIGRAIRHRGDYACVLLLDRRFHREGISNKLPHWISKLLRKEAKFGQVISLFSKFFTSKIR